MSLANETLFVIPRKALVLQSETNNNRRVYTHTMYSSIQHIQGTFLTMFITITRSIIRKKCLNEMKMRNVGFK